MGAERGFPVRGVRFKTQLEDDMEGRTFLKQAALTAAAASATSLHASPKTPSQPIAKRTLGKTGEKLSIIGFGGIVVMDETPGASSNIVAEAVDRGINYFDI